MAYQELQPLVVGGEFKIKQGPLRNVKDPTSFSTTIKYFDLAHNFLFETRYQGDAHQYTRVKPVYTPFGSLRISITRAVRSFQETIDEMQKD
jgi:hypothetical protein